MKRGLLFSFLILLFLPLHSQNRVHQLSLGEYIPKGDFNFIDIREGIIDLSQVKKTNGTLIIFTSNQCPFTIQWEDRYNTIATLADSANVGFALINSNARRRDKGDSYEMMISHAEELEYGDFFYLLDKRSRFANSVGAQTTPHVFLFDKSNKLVYKGAIDDNYRSAEKVEEFFVSDALTSLKKGIPILRPITTPKGCSIKRVFD